MLQLEHMKAKGAPRRGIYKNCIECGKEYYCIKSRISTAKYCSISCGMLGPNNWRWRGGTKSWAGYKLIMVGGKQVREHRHIVEQHIGRKLTRDEEVHHLDGDKTNNSIDNLKIMTKQSHATLHNIKRERDEFGRFKRGYIL